MEALIWIGAALAVAGLALLGWCVLAAARAKRAGLEGQAMADRLRGLVAVNLGALALSGLGLAMLAVGLVAA